VRGNHDAGVHHAILLASDELFARHHEHHVPRAVDDLDAWYLTSLSELTDLNAVGLERFVERDIVQSVNAGPTQMKDFDRAVLLAAGEFDALQRI